MALERCTLQVFVDGSWKDAVDLRCVDTTSGIGSPTSFDYELEYVETLDFTARRDAYAVSCRYPTTLAPLTEPHWPAFLLDVIPSGAARRHWERALALPNNATSDWAILLGGGSNPPGNVRVAEAAARLPALEAHAGFDRRDLLERADEFIEYAQSRGAPVAGASGAGGDAPKFLLREALDGTWHADGALEDARTRRSWIVKFPRSPRAADRLVLQAEAPFMRIAKRLGARVGAPPIWENDCLFVERFDRHRNERDEIERYGLESLCSLAGVAEFGPTIPKERLLRALAKHSTEKADDLREFLLRDILDVALGNTDNHARNTAVLKTPDGSVTLSPLYDFAPMVLDPQLIARVSRWTDEEDGFPVWSRVVDVMAQPEIDPVATKQWLRELAPAIRSIPTMMKEEAVPPGVEEALGRRIERVAKSLADVR